MEAAALLCRDGLDPLVFSTQPVPVCGKRRVDHRPERLHRRARDERKTGRKEEAEVSPLAGARRRDRPAEEHVWQPDPYYSRAARR